MRSVAPDDLPTASSRLSSGPAPFFFGGARRSGTTWLAGMLNAHPQIECRNEAWVFNDLGCSLPEWLDEDAFRAWATRREAQGTWLRDISPDDAVVIVRRAMWTALVREAVKRERWKNWETLKLVGDKTTTHLCTNIREIARTFPDARFLHMIRDGRDAVVSDAFLLFRELEGRREVPADVRREALAAREYHVFRRGRPAPLLPPAMLTLLAGEWARVVSDGCAGRALLGPRYVEVRYEQIAADPATALGRILAALGVDHDGPLVERIVGANTFERLSGGRARGQEDPGAEFRKGVEGDWRNYFTNETTRQFKAIAGSLLIELGYEPDMNW